MEWKSGGRNQKKSEFIFVTFNDFLVDNIANNMKISVIVHPNSKNPRIESDLTNMLHVYVNAPPLEGKANMGVAGALAKYFKTKKGKILLIRGEKSKNKVFEIG